LWLDDLGLPLRDLSDLDELGRAKVGGATSMTVDRRFFSLPAFLDIGILIVGVPIFV
jgi:hypothetical protein